LGVMEAASRQAEPQRTTPIWPIERGHGGQASPDVALANQRPVTCGSVASHSAGRSLISRARQHFVVDQLLVTVMGTIPNSMQQHLTMPKVGSFLYTSTLAFPRVAFFSLPHSQPCHTFFNLLAGQVSLYITYHSTILLISIPVGDFPLLYIPSSSASLLFDPSTCVTSHYPRLVCWPIWPYTQLHSAPSLDSNVPRHVLMSPRRKAAISSAAMLIWIKLLRARRSGIA
jgi:hypothetical protein